jgi:hypothetical protein
MLLESQRAGRYPEGKAQDLGEVEYRDLEIGPYTFFDVTLS